MRRCLKYILIGLIMFIGVDNVGAEEIDSCAYEYSSTVSGTKAGSHIKSTNLYAIGTRISSNTKFTNYVDFMDNGIIESVDSCPKYVCVVSNTKSDSEGIDSLFTDTHFGSYNGFYVGECKEKYLKGLFNNYDSLYQFVNNQDAPTATESICLSTLGKSKTTCIKMTYKDGKVGYNVDGLYSNKASGYKPIKVIFDDTYSELAYNKDTKLFNPAYCEIKSVTEDEIKLKVYFYQAPGTTHCSAINYQTKDEFVDDKDVVVGDGVSLCDNISETGKLLRQAYNLLKYLIPVLVIVLSIVDFLKVVISGEEKIFKESWTKFVKRIIIGIIILILPAILSLVINLSGVLDNYDINKNDIFCIFK